MGDDGPGTYDGCDNGTEVNCPACSLMGLCCGQQDGMVKRRTVLGACRLTVYKTLGAWYEAVS